MRFNLIVNDWDRKAFLISHFSDTSYNMRGDIVTEDSVDMPWSPVLGAGCSWGEGGVRHGGGGGGQGGEGARPGDGGGGPGHGEVGAPAPSTWSPHCPPHSPEASPQGGGSIRFLV